MQKLRRQVLFNAGVDFHGTSRNSEDMHPDELKRMGCEEFKRKANKIIIQEMNLDERILKEQLQKKEAFLLN